MRYVLEHLYTTELRISKLTTFFSRMESKLIWRPVSFRLPWLIAIGKGALTRIKYELCPT